ncbi:MAG TPA: aspartyl beta-hydroxylase [Crenotrichaceae bacterium]|nr:aspartyl beta-hydroxylase [Crenotrichaceae bacterium]
MDVNISGMQLPAPTIALPNLQPVHKPATIKNLGSVNIEPLLLLLQKLPDSYWNNENRFKENKFQVFHSTQHIVFRFIENFMDPRVFYSEPSWKLFQHSLLPVMNEVAARYDYAHPQFPKAMLARLNAGANIDQHKDNGNSNHYVHKIHVPLLSTPKVKFLEGKQTFFLKPGNAYEVNNLIAHGVVNDSEQDRIHFIFELFNDEHS